MACEIISFTASVIFKLCNSKKSNYYMKSNYKTDFLLREASSQLIVIQSSFGIFKYLVIGNSIIALKS